MNTFINSISTVEWVLLAIAVLALLLAWLAFRRAGRVLRLLNATPLQVEQETAEPAPKDERAAVSLEIVANRDEHDQVSLLLSNSGLLAARQITFTIDAPARIFDSEGLSGGVEAADVTNNSAILPRLAVLDADNVLPVAEILPGKQFELAAVLTMAFGKICDFPVSLNWKDGDGNRQQMKAMLTV